MAVLTSQKSWRYRRVLLSGDWESPSERPVRFHIPTTFQTVGKLKQPIPTRADIQKVERVKKKVPTADRIYSDFLFIANLIKARLVDPSKSNCFYYCFDGCSEDVGDLKKASPNRGQGQEAAATVGGLFGLEGRSSRAVS
ncbi:unnamed protein product [Prunus armeniaca]